VAAEHIVCCSKQAIGSDIDWQIWLRIFKACFEIRVSGREEGLAV